MEQAENTITLQDISDKLLAIFISDNYERPVMTKPFCVGENLVTATDAKIGIIIDKKYCKGDYSNNETIGHFFQAVPINPQTGKGNETNISFSLTSEMLQAAIASVPLVPEFLWCNKCDDEGDVTCRECGYDHTCEDCKGEGTIPLGNGKMVPDEHKRISVGEVLFGIPILQKILSVMDISGIHTCLQTLAQTGRCNIFDFGEFVLYAMPVKYTEEDEIAYTIKN